MCVGGLISLVCKSSTCRCLLSYPLSHMALHYVSSRLPQRHCSCQTDPLTSGALSFYMVDNHFVVSWLHWGKEMVLCASEHPQNCPLHPLWIRSLNHCLLAPEGQVPILGESFHLLTLHFLKHYGFWLKSFIPK